MRRMLLPAGAIMLAVAGYLWLRPRSFAAQVCSDGFLPLHVTFEVNQADTVRDEVLNQQYLQYMELSPGADCRAGSFIAYGRLPTAIGGSARGDLVPSGSLMVMDKSGAAEGEWRSGAVMVLEHPTATGRMTLTLAPHGDRGSWAYSERGLVVASGSATARVAAE